MAMSIFPDCTELFRMALFLLQTSLLKTSRARSIGRASRSAALLIVIGACGGIGCLVHPLHAAGGAGAAEGGGISAILFGPAEGSGPGVGGGILGRNTNPDGSLGGGGSGGNARAAPAYPCPTRTDHRRLGVTSRSRRYIRLHCRQARCSTARQGLLLGFPGGQ